MKNSETILRAILIIVFFISIASLTLPGNCSASQTYPSIRPIKFIDDPLPKPYTDDGEPGDVPDMRWYSNNNNILSNSNIRPQPNNNAGTSSHITFKMRSRDALIRYILNLILIYRH